MFHSQKFFAIAALTIMLLTVLSCGGRHTPDELFLMVGSNIQIPYWKAAGAGFAAAAQQYKVRADFSGPDSYDPKGEKDALDQAIQKKPNGILLAVTDPTLLKDSIDRAIGSGIPVITIDADARTSKRLVFIGTNNYEAGVMGGKRLAQELKDKGNVVVFTMPEQTNLADRLRGYRDVLDGHPGIKITQIVNIKGDPRVAFDTTTEIVGKERDKVDAFVCLEAQAGKEVATVLSSNKVTGKVIVAMDTDPDTLDWIQKGVIAATIAQKPYTMAMVGLRLLDDLYHNPLPNMNANWSEDSFSPLPVFIDTGTALIDKSNVQAFQEAQKSATGSHK